MSEMDEGRIINLVQTCRDTDFWLRFDMEIWATPSLFLRELYVLLAREHLRILTGLAWYRETCYDKKTIILYREDFFMKAKFTIRIPYGERSRYFAVLQEINALVDRDGCCLLFVNNNPYNLDAILAVETHENAELIRRLIQASGLAPIPEQGLEELAAELSARKWDSFSLTPDPESTMAILQSAFYFREKAALRECGYDMNFQATRKKVFISYCHKDKQAVQAIVEDIKQAGFYIWIDAEEIDIGDNILERVSDGIAECDLAILFLSNNTIRANMARHELFTYLKKAIYQKKKIAPVLLDDVDPDRIIEGLGGYDYFSYYQTPRVDLLIERLQKKLAKI